MRAILPATAAAVMLSALALTCLSSPPRAVAVEKGDPDPVRIAMVQTLFADVPIPLVNLLTPQFRGLMKDFTGLNGAPSAGGDAYSIAKDLVDDKVHLGVLHGVEYAWVKAKHPELEPLMIAVSKYNALKAHVVVRGDSEAAKFCDLKGKDCSVHFRAREHLRLFVEKSCLVHGKCDPKSYFGSVVKSANAETALDDVLAGKLEAAVVDTIGWEVYANVKPGCHKRLKVLEDSESFPTAVVVYHRGALNDATLNKFRQGMMSAIKSAKGRDLMNLWKLTSFEAVPPTYEADCAAIARSYPAPIVATTVSRPK
jgi:ABC-type phosphate/phosphonate transport system substrate-binding protein